ncbi:MAG: polysaccharide export protein [Verrucomicrobia bacterium]|nr:polysaccharide export protein [Verrucomicrobiota bacterium]
MTKRTSDKFSFQHGGLRLIVACAAVGLFVLGTTGCQAPQSAAPMVQSTASEPQTLREGDIVKIVFPGTQNLDSQQTVRRDGRITLPIVGEVKASGKTPADLEKELLQLFASQLVSKEVSVTVVSSSYVVFVSGAVMRPGKLVSDHPMTALEAVMEAGGFNSTKADMRGVVIIRNEDGKTKNFTIDLKQVLDGQSNEPFYLKPSDIIFVPERFSWF